MSLPSFRRLSVAAVVVSALALGACSSSSTASSAASSASVDTCGAMYDAYVAYSGSCSNGGFTGPAARERYVSWCRLQLEAPGNSNAATSLSACTAAVKAATSSCGPVSVDACAGPKTGSFDAGVACSMNGQCASGYCAHGAGDPSVACGRCARTAAIGASCSGDATTCGAVAICQTDGTNATCVAAPADKPGDACGDLVECKGDLVCDTSTRTCKPRATQGGACASSDECESPLVCVVDSCVLPKKVGEACSPNDVCSNGAGCDPTTNECVAIQLGDPGADCDLSTRACKTGVCQFDAQGSVGTCPAVLADGSPCSSGGTTTCDDFALCIDGVCKIAGALSCK